MRNIFKGKLVTGIIVVATVVLAGVAIFTALRLYQLRQQPVTPNIPASTPSAQDVGSEGSEFQTADAETCGLTFNLQALEPGLVCVSKTAASGVTGFKIADGSDVTPGQELSFTVSYANTGDGTSTGGMITDTLPAELEFIDSNDCTFSSGFTNTVTCTVDQVISGGTGQVSFDVKVSDTAGAGSFTNTATLTADEGNSNDCPITLNIEIPATTTPTPTGTSTPAPTGTPTPAPTTTPTPTEPALPQAGVDTPTTVGLGAGILILLFGLALAL